MRALRLAPFTAACALALAACEDPQPPPHLRIEGGDAARGRRLIETKYGCGACHTIEGIRSARGMVGPPLIDFAQRTTFAGRFPNAPGYMIPWLENPPAVSPGTAMPDLGVSREEARDITTYLYTLGADRVVIWPPLPAFSAEPREELARAGPGADNEQEPERPYAADRDRDD